MSWLDIPTKGSYLLSATRRRELAKSIRLIVEEGDDKSHINITIIDQGIGIKCEQMENTILNLGGGNKVQKPYLMGAYGQGGSSTYAFCNYSIICSKPYNSTNGNEFCFTIVFYEDLPPDRYKHGRFVYLVLDNELFKAEIKNEKTQLTTIIKHYGYDLALTRGELGPSSIYGLLQESFIRSCNSNNA